MGSKTSRSETRNCKPDYREYHLYKAGGSLYAAKSLGLRVFFFSEGPFRRNDSEAHVGQATGLGVRVEGLGPMLCTAPKKELHWSTWAAVSIGSAW